MIDVALFGAGRIGPIHAGNIAASPASGSSTSSMSIADGRGEARAAARRADGERRGGVRRCRRSRRRHRLVDRHACRPDPARGESAARRSSAKSRSISTLARARTCAEAVRARRRHLHDRLPAPLRSDVRGGQGAASRAARSAQPEMLIVTSRDPGAPPVDYIKRSGGIFKDMLIHDFDVFRWILGRRGRHRVRDGQLPDRPGDRDGRRRRLRRR